MIKALRKKFILINMLLVFLVLSVVMTVVAVSGCRSAIRDSEMSLQMLMNLRNTQSAPAHEPDGKAPMEQLVRSPMLMVRITGSGYMIVIATDGAEFTTEELSALLDRAVSDGAVQGVMHDKNLRWALRYDKGEASVAFIDRTVEAAAIRRSIILSALELVGALVAFFAISLFLSRWALKPVERAWEQQKRFVADASHELKTPLTVILANTGILLENREDTVENQLRWVENTATEAARMQKLVGNLLYLAKTDDAKTPFVPQRVCLSELALSTTLAFEALAYEKSVNILTDELLPDIFVDGDSGALSQLIAILLENAVKFSDANTDVVVSLRVQQSKAALTVTNRGSVLSEAERSQIFERFFRADTARASEGYGLGLSIAKSIVDAHHGKISVESSEQSGTCFWVKLALSQP